MLSIGTVVWGVRDLSRAIAFWSAALDYRPRRAPSEDWVTLDPVSGSGAPLSLMLVSAPAEERRRHHLDLVAEDRDAEAQRLIALGASPVDWRYEDDADYTVLADPDGNLFCIVDAPTPRA